MSLLRATAALAALLLQASPLAAQRGQIAGVVYDSLGHAPLVGAEVQIIRADSGATEEPHAFFTRVDDGGRFRVDSVPAGAYRAGFFHARLDSLGVALRPIVVEVAPGAVARAELAIPSARTLRRQLCGATSDSTGLVLGVVRDAATRAPRAEAVVHVEWTELVFGARGVERATPGGEVHARPDGWFALCGVPSGITVALWAAAAGDTTGQVPLQIAPGTITTRDLLVGGRQTARLRGVVRTPNGRPVAGARVVVAGAAGVATTSDSGTFSLVDLPAGSQLLEVRAVGYLPARLPVELASASPDAPSGASNETAVALTSLRSYLDTVRVVRQRVFATDRNGFARRQRVSGAGRFIDRDRIDRERPTFTTDLLRMVPGVEVRGGTFGQEVWMRDIRGNYCRPELYVDGEPMLGSSSADLDWLASPDIVDGIEVYARAASAPMEFSHNATGCGSVVVWTRAADPRPNSK